MSTLGNTPDKACKTCGGPKTRVTPGKNRPYHGCKACQAKNLNKYRYTTVGGKVSTLLASARHRAKRDGLSFDLTREWFLERINDGKCALTGLPFFIGENTSSGIADPMSPSVDRIIAGGPYIQSNCRLVVMMINMALNSWGETAFSAVAHAYVKAHP